MRTLLRPLYFLPLGWLGAFAAPAQMPQRLVDAVDVAVHDSSVDVAVNFSCSVRYLSHEPAGEGEVLRIRLLGESDCGSSFDTFVTGSVPGATAWPEYLRGMEVTPVAGREIALTVSWVRRERFVLAPEGRRGLRIRLLRSATRRGRVFLSEGPGVTAQYSINLESQRGPFDAQAIAAAEARTKMRPYVSQATLRGETWYRLRIGPIATESEAKRLLKTLRGPYPRAWLAIGDQDDTDVDTGEGPVGATVAPAARAAASGPLLTAPERVVMLADARRKFRGRDYRASVPLLTRLVEQPEFPERVDAQELLGLARERLGQLAHAKAEYEEYLTRYPQGRAAARVRDRLRTLRSAYRSSRDRGAGGGVDADRTWTFVGAFSQLYRRDESNVENSFASSGLTAQNAVLSDGELVARRRGERFDFTTRLSLGFAKDLLGDGPGDQLRVSAAYAELGDRERGWQLRGGRQSRNSGGVLGSFDGVWLGYQVLPRLRLNFSGGSPVDSTLDGFDGQRRFLGVSADMGPFRDAWDFTAYALEQQIESVTDRRAIGAELRYFRPGRTLVGIVDYDLAFRDINGAMLLYSQELPGRWVFNVNVDQRKSPLLALRNAAIGQPVRDFQDLFGLFFADELERLARDRTADSRNYSLSAYRPLGDRFRLTLDVSSSELGSTPASGGVEAVPAQPRADSFSVQLFGSSLLRASDVHVLALRYQSDGVTDLESLGLISRWPLRGAWRIGPRLRVDRRTLAGDGALQWVYMPSLRLEYQRARTLLELDLGAEHGTADRAAGTETVDRYYLSVGYRMVF
ncbi:MAG: SPOR domain-containing protein [Gammaproteobacteria bacterium]|nr:SPOR domain-containing protein [Gammaproteobacteria bacterium]